MVTYYSPSLFQAQSAEIAELSQAEGLKDNSRWLRSGATTPPDENKVGKNASPGKNRLLFAVEWSTPRTTIIAKANNVLFRRQAGCIF
jgi:hypothetical protein